MATAVSAPVTRARSIRAKHILWIIFALMLLLVWWNHDRMLLDARSGLRLRYAPLPWLMLAHGVPGVLALGLGVFQFSDRLRRRYLSVHRVMGYIYVVSTFISAPVALGVSWKLDRVLFPASMIQAVGWMTATATALYCVRIGNIQQHREWMMRGYPFAAVFVVVRAILEIPAVQRLGEQGLVAVVWGVIAVAGIAPSFVIAWQKLPKKRAAA